MKTARCFGERVRRKRPYIDPAWYISVVATPLRREEQPDDRIRFRGEVTRPGETVPHVLRVVTLDDGETIHNAFFDRGFRQGSAMKLHYYPETDSLYIELKTGPGAETREVSDGLNVDLDDAGEVVGFDIDHASQRFDLSTLETTALPLRSTKAG